MRSSRRKVRLRYLVKDPDVYNPRTGTIVRGLWRRAWSREWTRHRGAKKIMSGRHTMVTMPAQRGWG